jgi:diguanylate cyclase
MDLPCRYGGEEFVVVLPASDIRESRVAAERFRVAIQAAVTNFEGQRFSVTASIGVAEISEQDDPVRLLRRADDALYKSKEAGRNCGHWHDGTNCIPLNCEAPENDEPPAAVNTTVATRLLDRLPSHDVFRDTLQRRVTESQRFGIPLSVMQLRINDYAGIKREYGKSIANLMLDSVAQFAQSTLREMDLLARGDEGEFSVMLPGSTEAEVVQVAKRLQSAMADCSIPIRDGKVPLRALPGIAQLQQKESAAQLMARAIDAANAAMTPKLATV